METQFCSLLEEAFREKGAFYFSYFFYLSPKPWFKWVGSDSPHRRLAYLK